MQTYDTALAQEFRKLVEARMDEVKANMAFGSFNSFEAYREYVGYHRGLADALDLIDHAFKKLDERVRGEG